MSIEHSRDRLLIAAYDAYEVGLPRALLFVASVAQQCVAGSGDSAFAVCVRACGVPCDATYSDVSAVGVLVMNEAQGGARALSSQEVIVYVFFALRQLVRTVSETCPARPVRQLGVSSRQSTADSVLSCPVRQQ